MFKTIDKHKRHILLVQHAMFAFADILRDRALNHDNSKFQEDELTGYAQFELMPEGLGFGSDKYWAERAKLLKDNTCFELHAKRNDHHPEYYEDVHSMGLFALIEMVCDWAGATLTYNNGGNWTDTVLYNIERFDFSPEQRFVIAEVASFLEEQIPELREAK